MSSETPGQPATPSPDAVSSETPGQPATPSPDAVVADPVEEVRRSGGAHPVLVYTALRLGLLVVVAGILYLLGLRDIWLLLFAFLLSGILSIFVLDRRREVAAATMVGAVQKANQRLDESARAEDAAVAIDDPASTPTASGAAGAGEPTTQPQPQAPRRRDEIPADDDLDD